MIHKPGDATVRRTTEAAFEFASLYRDRPV